MDVLREYFHKLDMNLTEDEVEKFLVFEKILLETNKKMNLTSITESKEIYEKHFLDSASLLLSNKIKKESKIIDIGTGAGFPGVPIKILREDINITLLDALKKRIDYLNNLCTELNLEKVELIHGRAEDYGRDENYREKFDIVVSRAVANLRELLEYASPFIKEGGYFISLKGKKYKEELSDSKNAMDLLQMELEEIIKVPLKEYEHYLIIFRKNNILDSRYPRSSKKISKKPL